MTMRNTRVLTAAAGIATALAAAGATWLILMAGGSSPAVIVGSGADLLPNQTAQDWVTYADHVVAVTPVSEAEVPPTAQELARGEGLIGRTLELRVDAVVWSRRDAVAPPPTQFTWQAFGWQFTDGDLANRVPLAAEDAPRLELGHRYLLAINWQEQRCSEGDFEPAHWEGLGADAIVPYDGAVIGQGEYQGSQRSVAQARSDARAAGAAALEDQLVGQGAGALRSALVSAKPAPAAGVQRRPPAAC